MTLSRYPSTFMRAIISFLIFLFLNVTLSGCGQTGPLYPPDQKEHYKKIEF